MNKYLIEQTNEKGEVQTYHVSGEYLKDKQLNLRHYIINTCDVSESTKTIIYKQMDLNDSTLTHQELSDLLINFIQYCEEDNEQLAKDIRTWLIDYVDEEHRTIPLNKEDEAILETINYLTETEYIYEHELKNGPDGTMIDDSGNEHRQEDGSIIINR